MILVTRSQSFSNVEGPLPEWLGNEAEWKAVRRGWGWGVKSSGASRWRRWGSLNGGSRYREELKESDEARARRIVEEEIRGLKFPDLNRLMKGAEKKVKIAAGLRAKPAVPLKSVAQELGWEASRMCPSVCRSGRRSEKPWD